MRVVLDTDVIVAALRSPAGASAAILDRIANGVDELVLTASLALEYEAICHLAEHRLASGLSEKEVGIFVNTIIGLAEPVEVYFLWRPSVRDPVDEMVLEAAVNGRADAIVTFNRRDYGEAPSRFGIEVLFPRDALRRMRT
ncbi:MAG TPA: putative toxin-antitoxin system toxin component, PIN family [Bryobacteraceae bacterium]|nr:putative toxin-antitoxin system toxin component, PIN family [Bryobacteraceae bacterium]